MLKDTSGERHVIPAAEIVSRTKQKVSTMPDNVALGLAPQDLADLVAFLASNPRAPGKRLETRSALQRQGPRRLDVLPRGPEGEDGGRVVGRRTASCTARATRSATCARRGLHELRARRSSGASIPRSAPGNSGVLLRMTGADKVWPKSIEAQLQHRRRRRHLEHRRSSPMQVDPARTRGPAAR